MFKVWLNTKLECVLLLYGVIWDLIHEMFSCVAGGKAYGLLKSHQEEKLNSINEVKLPRFVVNI